MILCCGEALIDMIPRVTVEGSTGFVPHAGGAVFNTAVALGRLGARVGLVSGVSTDSFGDILMTELVASNVSTSTLIRANRPSTMAFVHLRSGQATYSFYDENTAGRMIQPSDLVSVEPKVKALFFGGISLAVEPCADTYAELLEREGAGRAVMVDPNIRPGFIANEKAYRARLAKMFAKADIVKLSDEDLAWLVPGDDTLDERAMQVVDQGPALVLITRGGDGADAYLTSGHKLSVAAAPAEVVDTVGAGDTFNASVLAKLSELGVLTKAKVRDLSLEDAAAALAFGAKVAGVTVSRAGANPPWASELA